MPVVLRKFQSVFGNTVVLTSERLDHMLSRHVELRKISKLIDVIGQAVEKPDFVILGICDEHLAIRSYAKSEYIVVPYDENGQVRTAFITSKISKIIEKREIMWRRS